MKNCMLVVLLCCALSNAFCNSENYSTESREICKSLTLDEKIGQMMMVSVPGKEMNSRIRSIITKYRPGGIILFGYNVSSRTGTKRLISQMQSLAVKNYRLPMFISIDQEGGRVKRVVDGVTQFPGNMAAGIAGDRDLVFQWARILGMQLRFMGINMNLAPALDVNNNPGNPVINTRSFGSDPVLVALLGVSYILGLQESLCIAIGKHFPGHGDTNIDSHRALPVIPFNLERLNSIEFIPFVRAIQNGVEGIMTAHISFPQILKSSNPATVSEYFLTGILQKKMGFKGLIMTDDMEMNAISKTMDIGEGAVKSVQSGADIVLISSYGRNIGGIFNSLKNAVKQKRISMKRIDASVEKIIKLKLKYRIMTYKEGKISLTTVKYSKKDLALLRRAERVNRDLSRKGILYSGDQSILKGKRKKLVVTANRVLRRRLEKSESVELHTSISKAIDSAGTKSASVYYHIERGSTGHLRDIKNRCDKRGVPVVFVLSGNPFPFTSSGSGGNYLMSFSNTDESLRQLGSCIMGDFQPKTKHSLELGLEN
jgi:beta-glucosidase-like glycosyl hydrolase